MSFLSLKLFCLLAPALLGVSALATESKPAASATLQKTHADLLTLDTHIDIPRSYMQRPDHDASKETPLKVDLPKMREGGLDAAFLIVYVEQGALDAAGYARAVAAAERKFTAIETLLARNTETTLAIRSPQDVLRAQQAGKTGIAIGIENAYVLGHDLANLDKAFARGARYLGLTHAGDNDLCGSTTGHGKPLPKGQGISAFGAQVVKRANALGMMVDISHASDACVEDVLQISKAPIIASHSGARSVHPHNRNLPDALLRAIARKDGVIQVVAYSGFLKETPERDAAEEALKTRVAAQLGAAEFDWEKHEYTPEFQQAWRELEEKFPPATVDDYLDHLTAVIKLVGIDHVGIASDFDGGGGVLGWNDARETPNVTAGLLKRGMTVAQIQQLWSGNLLRVWRTIERQADRSATAAATRP